MSTWQKIARQPAVILGVVVAALNLAVLFGVHISADQLAAIGVLIGAVIGLIQLVVTPAGEVVAQQKPGQPVVAGQAANVDNGTPVHVITDAGLPVT